MKLLKEVDMGKMMPFDTLAYAKKLESRGVEVKHAEAHAEVLAEVLETNFSTKQDTTLAFDKLSQRIDLLQNDMDVKFAAVRSEIQTGFAEQKSEIIKWVIGVAFGQLTIIFPTVFAMIKYVH